MNAFRSFQIPSLEATLNVFWETVKAYMPDNSPCMELLKRKNKQVDNEQDDKQNWFNENDGKYRGENTEMATLAEEGYEATGSILNYMNIIIIIIAKRNFHFFFVCLFAGVAEDGFITRQQNYQQTKGGPSMASIDFSESEFGEGGIKKGHKIDEWQAAWNVTNAIQVCMCV